MQDYLFERVEHYKNEIISALDRNDYIEALKCRAVLKELEDLSAFSKPNAIGFDKSEYYSTAEASKLLCITPSALTRKARKLGGYLYNHGWWFRKEIILEEQNRCSKINKRGRKKKIDS